MLQLIVRDIATYKVVKNKLRMLKLEPLRYVSKTWPVQIVQYNELLLTR